MIDFKCPKCGKELSVPDSNAGEWTICPFCDAEVRPPAAEAVPWLGGDPSKRPSSTCWMSWILMFIGYVSMPVGFFVLALAAVAREEAVGLGGCIAFIGGWIIIGLGSAIGYLASIRHLLVEMSDQLGER